MRWLKSTPGPVPPCILQLLTKLPSRYRQQKLQSRALRKSPLNIEFGDRKRDSNLCTGWLIKHIGNRAEGPKKLSKEKKWFILNEGLLG